MPESPTLLLSKMTSLFILLNNYGIKREEFLRNEGIDPLLLYSPDSRISMAVVRSMLNRAEFLTGDKTLGLHQGEIYAGLPSILCYMMMSCDDLGMAIEKLCKYQHSVDETKGIHVSVENEKVAIQVVYFCDRHPIDRHLSEYQLCALYSFFKFLSGKDLSLEEVCFRHGPADDISEYHRIFKCPVIFQSNVDAISLKKALLRTSLLQPNRSLLSAFENHAEKILQTNFSTETYTKRVSCFILKNLQGAVPSVKKTANNMATSVRNLQLKLKQEGTTYTEVLKTTRIALAKEYLSDNNVSVSEISYLLGFSDPSVFHHFFKKATGCTPLTFRQK